MAPAVLAYWDIRGLAQPIRLLLEYAGMEWEDKLYVTGPAPDFDKSGWFGEKESLGFDFPNLPYFIDGPVKLTQTGAILRYIARKYKLDGATEEEKRRVDLIESEAIDFRSPFTGMCYNPNFTTLKEEYLAKTLPVKLQRFSKFLGDNPFFAGQNVTFVDFIMYEYFDQHKLLHSTCLKDFPNLQGFCGRIEALEKIDGFMKSPRFIKYPLNNRMAQFGG